MKRERERKFLTIIKTLNHHLGTLATMMMRSATTPDFRGNITSIHPHNTPGACRASFGGTLSNGSIITPFLSRITITERVFHHPCRRLRCRARKFTKSLSWEEEEEGRGSGERVNKDVRPSSWRVSFYLTGIRNNRTV